MESIILIAQQLSKEGKVPTTALIKGRLTKNVALPTIIQGLQMWKSNPHQKVEPTSIPSNTDSNLDALLDTRINLALTPLIAQIKALKNEITALHKQIEDKN